MWKRKRVNRTWKRRIVLLGYVIACIFSCLLVCAWETDNGFYCDIQTPKLIGNTLSIQGRVNSTAITVKINGHEVRRILTKDNEFQYDCDISDFKPGWYYYSFTTRKSAMDIWLHKVEDGKPSVLVSPYSVNNARNCNCLFGRGYRRNSMENYTAKCDYFNSASEVFAKSDCMDFDRNGIPLVNCDGKWIYNPVTSEQFALTNYGKTIKSTAKSKDFHNFLHITSWIMNYQNKNGSLPYDFNFKYNSDITIPTGFVSAMAQGQALSVYARAYSVTNDEKYLRAGKNALDFMLKPSGGCAATLSDFADCSPLLAQYKDEQIFEEYLCKPQTYVLNGDLFALMGLYDWSQTAPEQYGGREAKKAFDRGCRSIEVILPYYDYNGYSSYDLLPFTNGSQAYFSNTYAHAAHTYLLGTLAEITGSETFKKYHQLFASYSDDEFYKQSRIAFR